MPRRPDCVCRTFYLAAHDQVSEYIRDFATDPRFLKSANGMVRPWKGRRLEFIMLIKCLCALVEIGTTPGTTTVKRKLHRVIEWVDFSPICESAACCCCCCCRCGACGQRTCVVHHVHSDGDALTSWWQGTALRIRNQATVADEVAVEAKGAAITLAACR